MFSVLERTHQACACGVDIHTHMMPVQGKRTAVVNQAGLVGLISSGTELSEFTTMYHTSG